MGVLPIIRKIWVSVVIFVGIKFKIASLRGRISWVVARLEDMTKIFSLARISKAGKLSGILMGMALFCAESASFLVGQIVV